MTLRVLVAGAGAVGSWVGGALAAGGAQVALVARGEHGAAIAAGGLTLRGARGARIVHVHPTVVARVADAVALGPFDLTLVAVKSYDTAALADELAAAGPSACVASIQNGVGSEALLAAALPGSLIVPATLTTAVALVRPGVVEGAVKGGIGLGRTAGGEAMIADLAAGLEAGGLTVGLYPDAVAMKWSKLLLNLLGSATTAILDRPPAQVFADRRLFEIERRAWLEALAVVAALGLHPVALPGYPVPQYARLIRRTPPSLLYTLAWRKLAGGRGDRLPGVAADLHAGRPHSEVEVLGGAVVRAGAAAGIPTPVNRALTDLVTDLAAGRRARSEFAGRPEALLAALAMR